MPKFLLDENLSHETAEFLNSLGYDTKIVAQFRLDGANDEKIAEKAATTSRILITLDLDFGEMYSLGIQKNLGVVVLRLRNQTVESINLALKTLLDSQILKQKENYRALIIVEEGKIRIRKKS
ncbi:MAG: DUF5615 family PIN-like protein [bacterium]|nr:DUF5615 family PIN-like protein [bacterium]